MKVAFVGKGGSGKTTLSALFARHLAERASTLAIDADINQNLGIALGLRPEEAARIPPLGIEIDRIKRYLRGSNTRIPSNRVMSKTTPPGRGSRLVSLSGENPLYDHFSRSIGGVRLLAAGPFSETDLGIRCYHSKVGAVELILNHLIDQTNEYAVVDMTAGADSFASGLFTRFDLTFLAVEPTQKSAEVYRQYLRYAAGFGVEIVAVGNKVEDEGDLAFLHREIGPGLLGCFARSDYVRSLDRGEWLPLAELEPENRALLEQMRERLDAVKKDWTRFYDQAIEFHLKNARSWANAEAGADLTEQIDPDFSLEEIAASLG